MKSFVILLASAFLSAQAYAAPQSFCQAKIELQEHVYHDRNEGAELGTLYCGCD